ncbi:glycosyltransferase family 2 protein [uncultured Ilyobacter sp.]|uniref:glycosyltransferase family 2 protein n=1 Tax=uncultured Ilyobacter sp. TaxID=544433 RepID=UPI002AA79038|nr:glycosyltransferase family 2 protein [uncultured Ilyobacter sp.]
MKKITILVPAYNEEEVLEQFYARVSSIMNKIKEYKFELLFINDGSRDKTLDIIKSLKEKDKRVNFIDLSRNYGKEIAMSAGFDHVKGDAVVIMDADLQDPPELIPQMIEEWENDHDDVYAKRVSRKGETWLKKMTSYLFYRVLEKVSRVPIQKDTGDFRLLSKKALKSLIQLRESQRYTKGLFSLIGHKKKAIEYERDPRAAGETKWNYFKLFDLAIEGITSFTVAPLRIASILGILISIVSFIYMLKIVFTTIISGNEVPGYPSLMSVTLFIGGVQLLGLGVIGEYLGRVFSETKKRPLYFINEYSGEENE